VEDLFILGFVVAVVMWKSLFDSKACGKDGKQLYRFPGFP
jgi:hypothetical protein